MIQNIAFIGLFLLWLIGPAVAAARAWRTPHRVSAIVGMELRVSAESRHWMIFDAKGNATHWWPTSGKAKLPNGSRANIATLLQLREKLESINTP